MTGSLDQFKVVSSWKRVAQEKIRDGFRKRKIHLGNLYESIVINIVSSANGDVQKVAFMFDAYGRFIDMGVGRGWAIGGRREHSLKKMAGREVSKKPRRMKKFYSKTIFHEGHRLHEIMVEKYGVQMVTTLERELDGGKINL